VTGAWRVPDLTGAITAGLREWAETIAADAAAKAPILTGDLRASVKTDVQGDQAAVGFTDPVAVGAHENMQDRHPRGGQAKFLELAVQENQNPAALARHIGGVL
jgi:hypothetical protein